MTPFPLALEALFGKAGMYLVFLVIGIAFGWSLEISGFAISTRLAAQFYFKDLTVLKVMFTAIIVAMVLLFSATALGLLDFNLIWVNPTYLWSGIIGGLIMGVGFIIGGFCPGTSLVSMATFKIDGGFFALGTLFGIFVFGETEQLFDAFYNGSYYSRLTLPEFLGLPVGVTVLLVVLMAVFMFWGGEQLERIFGGKNPKEAPRIRIFGAGVLVLISLALIIIGQPTTARKWAMLAPTKEQALIDRQVQIHPGELLTSIYDSKINIVMLDVRDEADYNLFHLRGARLAPLANLTEIIPELLLEPAANTVYVVMSNDELAATQAWMVLTAESVPNVYILEGGINHWLDLFASEDSNIAPTPIPPGDDRLKYTFPAALGDRFPAADPSLHDYEFEYTPKIQLQTKRGPSGGGCG
ncbi:MAG: YeeE/YedE family protein [Anaerolineales bacterium]|nr:YeeE/YedE family protein [Anaerolineales bacterium]